MNRHSQVDPCYHRSLFGLAVAVACATFPLIFVGGSVTSMAAGMAFPDWPLSHGSINPEGWLQLRDRFIEHSHRLLGALTGLLVIALAVCTQRVERRPWVRKFGWVLLAAVCAQGALGGARVLLDSTGLAAVHGVTAPVFFSMTLLMAVFLSRAWHNAQPIFHTHALSYRRLCMVTVAAILLQTLLGALLRHLGFGLALHVLGAVLASCMIGAMILWTLGDYAHQPAQLRFTRILAVLLGLQLVLGMWAWLVTRNLTGRETASFLEWAVPTAHVATGAMLLGTAVVLTAFSFHAVKPQTDRQRVSLPDKAWVAS